MGVEINLDFETLDTLTVRFFRDQPGPLYRGPDQRAWGCFIGPDIVGGAAGFGSTPLAALRDLCDTIAKDEGHKTDNGKLLLR